MVDFYVNYSAVLVGAIVNMVLGAFWYSPAGFGKKWMKLSGITMKDIEKAKPNMNRMYAVTFVGALVMSYVLGHVISFVGAESVVGGAYVAFWMWLGFAATTSLGSAVWGQKPIGLYFLDNGYWLVALMIIGAIHAAWA